MACKAKLSGPQAELLLRQQLEGAAGEGVSDGESQQHEEEAEAGPQTTGQGIMYDHIYSVLDFKHLPMSGWVSLLLSRLKLLAFTENPRQALLALAHGTLHQLPHTWTLCPVQLLASMENSRQGLAGIGTVHIAPAATHLDT